MLVRCDEARGVALIGRRLTRTCQRENLFLRPEMSSLLFCLVRLLVLVFHIFFFWSLCFKSLGPSNPETSSDALALGDCSHENKTPLMTLDKHDNRFKLIYYTVFKKELEPS
jgi:hypothetical protein